MFLFVVLFMSHYCWGTVDDQCSSLTLELVNSYQVPFYNYPSQQKAERYVARDLEFLATLNDKPTDKQCLTLHRSWQERHKDYLQKQDKVWPRYYNSWADWVVNNPLDVRWFMSGQIMNNPDEWEWLESLCSKQPPHEEEETDVSSLMSTYKNGFYKIIKPQDLWEEILNVLRQILEDVRLVENAIPYDTDFVNICANLHLFYQHCDKMDPQPDVPGVTWWDWVKKNSNIICGTYGVCRRKNSEDDHPLTHLVKIVFVNKESLDLPTLRRLDFDDKSVCPKRSHIKSYKSSEKRLPLGGILINSTPQTMDKKGPDSTKQNITAKNVLP